MTAEFTTEDLSSLGAKLDALDLTAGEAAALGALIGTLESAGTAAGGGDVSEVVGFAFNAVDLGFQARLGSLGFWGDDNGVQRAPTAGSFGLIGDEAGLLNTLKAEARDR